MKPDGQSQANKIGSWIRQRVLSGADGVFLWAQLLLDQLERKDLKQIESILETPPSSLDDMICSVFDRISKDGDVDQSTVRRLLLLLSFARHPLRFDEIYFLLSLPTGESNFLLWESMHGALSSILKFDYPGWYRPVDGTSLQSEEARSIDGSSLKNSQGLEEHNSHDVGDNYKGGDDDNDDDDDMDFTVEDEGNIDQNVARTFMEELSTCEESNSTTKEERAHTQVHFPRWKLRTTVSFSHQRFRDYLVEEGSVETRQRNVTKLNFETRRAEVDVTLLCMDTIRYLTSPLTDCDMYQEDLKSYEHSYWIVHLSSVQYEHMTAADHQKISEFLCWFMYERGFWTLNMVYDQLRDWSSEDNNETLKHWTTIIQKWLRRAIDTLSHPDPKKLQWLRASCISIPQLLRPSAAKIAGIWLKTDPLSRTETRYRDFISEDWALHKLPVFFYYFLALVRLPRHRHVSSLLISKPYRIRTALYLAR